VKISLFLFGLGIAYSSCTIGNDQVDSGGDSLRRDQKRYSEMMEIYYKEWEGGSSMEPQGNHNLDWRIRIMLREISGYQLGECDEQ